MNETVYVYIVHSDINENNIYAEFETEEEAIEYARRNKDELTYVDRVEVALDEEGDIIEEFDSETIWVYDEEDEDSVEEDDDYWNQLAEEEEDRKEDEALLGDTSWFEGLDTDKLVETLEENEDIVECKECFELFPKEACTKVAIGYICPECGKIHSHEEPEFEIDSIPDVVIADEDTFKVDFPELERREYENDMMPDVPTPEVGPNPEPMAEPCVGPECEAPVEAPVTKEETITKLVVDEHEAIDGYEKAKIEIEANSELDKEEKEEILDTIEHIKEEEIEHIEELEELVDEVEETKEADDPTEESEVEDESESEDESEVLVEGPIGRGLVGLGRTIAGTNPDAFWSTDPKNASKPLAPHEGYYIKEVIPNANGKFETTGIVKEAKKFTEAETIAKADSKLTGKHYLITPKGEDKKEYVYKLALYKDGNLVEKAKDWRKAAVDSKKASELESTPKEDERVEVEDPKPNENPTNTPVNTPTDTTPKYTAASLNIKVGKATYVVVKDAELNASVNIKDCTVTADKEGIVEVVQNPKNKRWVVKGIKPGKVTLTIKKGDKEICKCEVAVTVGKLSKEDQEALDRLRGLGYELTAPVAESLEEHVNEEHPAVESDQKLEGTDNAVVDCEVADIITHSEDEKPLDCEMEKVPLEKPLTEELSEDKLQVMEDYLKSTKFASLDTEWEEEGDFYLDIIGAYLDYSNRTNMFSLGLSIYHASEDNNAEYPERHTDEEEFNYDSLAEMYEDEECKEILDRIYLDNLAKLGKSLTETTCNELVEGHRTGDFVKLVNDKFRTDQPVSVYDLKCLMKSCDVTVKQQGLSKINLIINFDNNCEIIQETEKAYLVSVPCYFRNPKDRSQILDTPNYIAVWAPKSRCVKLEPVTEETHAQYAKPEGNRVQAYNNALKYAKKAEVPYIYGYSNHTGKFFALEQPIKVSGRPADAEKEFRQQYKNCKVVYVVYPDKTFLNEVLYNFTPEEQTEYGIDEEGQSLEGFDTYVRCNWCGEVYPEFDCKFEANLGWLCPRCQDEVRSHGGPLTIVEEPSEEQIQATLEN